MQRESRISAVRRWSAAALGRVDWMMLFPAAAAIAWGFGQDALAMLFAIVLPVFLAIDGRTRSFMDMVHGDVATLSTGRTIRRSALVAVLDRLLAECARSEQATAIALVRIDDVVLADSGWGDCPAGRVADLAAARIRDAMRDGDAVLRHGADTILVALAPGRRVDLDSAMALVDRIQALAEEPVDIDGREGRHGTRIGLCTDAMAPGPGGAALLMAAECALSLASRAGPGAVRTFTENVRSRVEADRQLLHRIPDALRSGAIRPWFQPQVDARTGAVTGVEALARWEDPDLGILSPATFLPAVEAAGRMAELGERITQAAMAAMRDWDRAGSPVPATGVNLSLDELRDPRLADRLAWQADRHDLSPERICLEILETVTLHEDDEVIVRNVRALRSAGFRLDLDDFGTGAASIAHIARFGVHRIKIDRSFVSGIASCEERRKIVAAMIGLADQLGVDCLAEGVETPEEAAILTQLGCQELQGYGIARPMPAEDLAAWISHRLPTCLPEPDGSAASALP